MTRRSAVPALLLGLAFSACPKQATLRAAGSPQDIGPVARGNNAFAIDLYRNLGEGNLFFSPYSISSALAMTCEGARGKTAAEIASTLHFPDSAVRRGGFAALDNAMNNTTLPGQELGSANALFAQQDYPFLPEYLETVGRYYGGKVENLDFRSEESRNRINAWVEERTHARIRNLFGPGSLSASTRLVLVNAIYFKGTWQYEFDKARTQDAPFHVSPSKIVQAKTMVQTNHDARYGYTEDARVQVLSMQYKGGLVSMLIVLPKQQDGLAAVEHDLSAARIEAWRKALTVQQLPVSIPKFTSTQEFELSSKLAAMGMPTAFKGDGTADFSGMTGKHDLYINLVKHKAFVKVDEEGTEAAASTAVVTLVATAVVPQRSFTADHPFLYMIVDKDSGAILFMGRVTDPSMMAE